MLDKLTQEQTEHFKKVAAVANDSYNVVFEGMRQFAEKMEETDSTQTDAHLLTVIKAAAELIQKGGTAGLTTFAKDVLASLAEYESFLEKYKNFESPVHDGADLSGAYVELNPDSLHAALDEYSMDMHQEEKDTKKVASKISRMLRNKVVNKKTNG